MSLHDNAFIEADKILNRNVIDLKKKEKKELNNVEIKHFNIHVKDFDYLNNKINSYKIKILKNNHIKLKLNISILETHLEQFLNDYCKIWNIFLELKNYGKIITTQLIYNCNNHTLKFKQNKNNFNKHLTLNLTLTGVITKTEK
jgi:hypothetical protein